MKEQVLELTLEFGQKQQDQSFALEARRSSSGGEASDRLVLPFEYSAFQKWAEGWGLGKGSRPTSSTFTSETVGAMLFDALFPGPIRNLFEAAKADAESSDHTLRILLRFDPKNPDHLEISSLPWELLRYPNHPTYICMDPKISLVRYLECAQKVQSPILSSKLRVLAVVANPSDASVTPFDRADCEAHLRGSLNAGIYELHILEKPTVRALNKYLRDQPCDVLHFTGHGGQFKGDWGLCFEKESGDLDFVNTETLVQFLSCQSKLRLVHLLSCNTGRGEGSFGAKPFAVLSNALMALGVPSVIGMQFPVTVEDVKIYTETFYERIAMGDAPEKAVNLARQDLLAEHRKSIVWATPVLFSRKLAHLWEPQPVQYVYMNTFYPTLPAKIEQDLQAKGSRRLHSGDLFVSKSDDENLHEIKDPKYWGTIYSRILRMREELNEVEPVCFEGRSWLSLWLALGFAFRTPRNFQVSVSQFNGSTQKAEVWAPDPRVPPAPLAETWVGEYLGGELVVSFGVARDLHQNVATFRATHPNLRTLPWMQLGPEDPNRSAVADGREAAALANAFVARLQGLGHDCILHLFVATPAALAFMITHGLSASGKIQVYENLNQGYTPAFLLE